MPDVIFRTLRHEYKLLCPDEATARALAFMEIIPDMPSIVLAPKMIPVELDQHFFRISLNANAWVEGDASRLLNHLHGVIFDDMLQSEVGCPILHCGTFVNPFNPQGRIAVVGAKGQGKTTLILKLLTEGFQVEGDEHLVLREHDVVARPRTLRVKHGSLKYVPELASAVLASPSINLWDGGQIYAFNPQHAGLPWQIKPASLDHVIFIEANHGGRSLIHPLSADKALKRVLTETILPKQGTGAAFARLRGKLGAAHCHCLRLGELDLIGEILRRHLSFTHQLSRKM